ncbi:hypothetical protein BC834DRAFT_975233 [Gloeopeniophorella convolvens]|nr:hypothetical protein BC834DRAFT_975233 [Gloeopeniophorella convolvens]
MPCLRVRPVPERESHRFLPYTPLSKMQYNFKPEFVLPIPHVKQQAFPATEPVRNNPGDSDKGSGCNEDGEDEDEDQLDELLDAANTVEDSDAGESSSQDEADSPSFVRGALIPRPSGGLSRLSRNGGYNLKEALKCSDDLYAAIRAKISELAEEYLDMSLSYRSQAKKKLQLASHDYPMLKQYEGCWVGRDFLHARLKTSSQLSRQKARQADPSQKSKGKQKAID